MKWLTKEVLKEYQVVKNIFVRGGIFTLVIFLLGTIKNPISLSFYLAIVIWVICILLFFLIIFNEEYYKKMIVLKRLKSKRYQFLRNIGFEITEDLILKGTYNDYEVYIYPITQFEQKKRNILYDVIHVYYYINNCDHIEEKEEEISGDYHIGTLYFGGGVVSFIPKDWKNPDFEEALDSLITILRLEDFSPRQDFTKKQ